MGEMIREICFISLASAVACSIAPENTVKTVLNILSSVILMLIILKPMTSLDMSQYASSLAKYREMEQQLTVDAEDMQERLNRLVIEKEYEAYIKDKATEMNIELAEINIKLEWDTHGYWMPVAVEIGYTNKQDEISKMIDLIEVQLGLPEEKQHWYLKE